MQSHMKGIWLLAPVLAGSLAMAAGACNRSSVEVKSSVEAKVGSKVTITKADKDQTVKVGTGGQVIVRLTWSPGTGYDWMLTQNDPSALRQEGEASSEPAKQPMPGAPEVRIFQFKALKAGSTALEFQSRRPFEKDAPPLESFRVQVMISD